MALPNGYTELEYIQSSGTQYIDTGFCPKADTRVVADVYILNKSANARIYGSTGNNCNFGIAVESSNYTYVYYGNTYKRQSAGLDNGRNSIDQNGTTATIVRGSITKTVTITNATFNGVSPYPLYICACNYEGTVSGLTPIRVYSCQIYDGETLVRDYVPVLGDGGKVGLYDLVNNVFYANRGTGVFMSNLEDVRKAVPPNEYTKLEYIQSDSNQYVDTGFCPTANSRVKTNVYILDKSFVQTIYGSIGDSCNFSLSINSSGIWQMQYGDKT